MIGFVKTSLLRSKASSKTQSDFELSVFFNINELQSTDIAMLGNSTLLSKDYLATIEQNVNSSISPIYLKISNKATGAAYVLYAQLYTFDTKHFYALNKKGKDNQYCYKEVINSLFLKALNCLQCKVLVLGNMYYSGCIQPLQISIIEAINNHLKDTLHVDCIVVKDVQKPLENLQKKYYSIPVQPAMNLQLLPSWNSMEDYINALLPKYRKRWNNTKNKNAALKIVTLREKDYIYLQPKMYELYEAVFNKSETTYNKVLATYFAAMKKSLGDNYNTIAIFENDELLAFVSYIKNDGKIVAEFVGYELSKNKTLKLYQTLLYTLIEHSINSKASTIEFGRTGLEIKSTLGAQPVAYHSYLQFYNTFIHKQVGDIMNNLKEEEWLQRSPFK